MSLFDVTTVPGLRKVAQGKVRDLYEIDKETLLFVASDRISAYDVIMKNVIPRKGEQLTTLSVFWFKFLESKSLLVDGKEHRIRHHLISTSISEALVPDPALRNLLQGRSMVVRRLKVFPVEAIVRGYITGSGWSEYRKNGTIGGIMLSKGLIECQQLDEPLYTPSTKAELGGHDENITPARVVEMIGYRYAKAIEDLALNIYKLAAKYALSKGIIIADTKFEFGLDSETDEVILIDEVLTPDSSRFWPANKYQAGRPQDSFDKQYVRDYLTEIHFDKTGAGIELPSDVVQKTSLKYAQAIEMLTGCRSMDS